jgi:hypothetical protein
MYTNKGKGFCHFPAERTACTGDHCNLAPQVELLHNVVWHNWNIPLLYLKRNDTCTLI